MSGNLVHQPRGRVTIADEDGNGSGDYAYYETTKTVRAEIVAEDDPEAVEKAIKGLFKAFKKRPFNAAVRLWGKGCLFVFLGCIVVAIVRRGEPAVVTNHWMSWLSPNVWGTQVGYAVKPWFQEGAAKVHNGAVANDESIAEYAAAQNSTTLRKRTKVAIE